MNKEETKHSCEDGKYCYHDITERLGLEELFSFNDPEACYSFDEFRIWRRKSDGALFYGTDSGCSCPSPFEHERFGGIDSLTPITRDGWQSFKTAFAEYCGRKAGWDDDGARYVDPAVEIETLDKVRALL